MENILILKKLAQSVVLAGVIAFSATGVAQAAGVGEQTGEYGDMSGQGKGSNAPEPRGYQQSGSGSGQGSGQAGYDKPHDKRHDMHDKSYEKRSGQGGGSQGGGSSGQSGGGGY
jgi:hypothetical protein